MQFNRTKRTLRNGTGALAAVFAMLLGTACVGEDIDIEDTIDEPQVEEIDIDHLPPPMKSEIIYEVELINGNIVTFYAYEDGAVSVQEMGNPNTNAIGTLPELHGATPFEIFQAVAPADVEPPAELVDNHLRVETLRADAGTTSPMPEGFRVEALEGFNSELPPPVAFNTCTSTTNWMNHVGNSPIGSNCPGSSGKSWYACWANVNIPDISACSGNACTRYFTAGYNQVRASTCARSGSGHVRFVMGSKPDVGGSWSTWFDHTLYAGGYYYHWYSSGTQRDFWHLLYRTGSKRVNWSLWLDT